MHGQGRARQIRAATLPWKRARRNGLFFRLRNRCVARRRVIGDLLNLLTTLCLVHLFTLYQRHPRRSCVFLSFTIVSHCKQQLPGLPIPVIEIGSTRRLRSTVQLVFVRPTELPWAHSIHWSTNQQGLCISSLPFEEKTKHTLSRHDTSVCKDNLRNTARLAHFRPFRNPNDSHSYPSSPSVHKRHLRPRNLRAGLSPCQSLQLSTAITYIVIGHA